MAALVFGVLPASGARAIGQAAHVLASGGAGTNIGDAGQLAGTASGSLKSSASDDWWVIYPATHGNPVTVTVKNTTSASDTCKQLTASLDAPDGTSDVLEGATFGAGASHKFSGSRPGSDRYFVEVQVAGCEPSPGEPVTYTLTLDSGGGGTAPSPAAGSIAAGTSIGTAWPPLEGKTSYTGTIASGSSDDWYVLYKKRDTNPGTIRVEDTTNAGTVACAEVTVSLDAADGSSDVVSGATLGDNSATTFTVPGETGTDTAGLYYLEVNSHSCLAGGISYRIEPEPAAEWQHPARLPAGKAAPGSSIGGAWPPLLGGTTYDGTITSGSEENWYVLYKKPGTSPVSVRVEDTTVAGTTSCPGLTATLDGADGTGDTQSGATIGDNSAATLNVPAPGGPDYLGRYYLEIEDAGCPSGGATYRIEPEPGTGWANPGKPASARLPSGPDEKAAGGPLSGGITYDASLSNASSQDWVFFDAIGSAAVTVSVQDTTSSQDNCQEESVSLLDSGGEVSGATLGDDDGTELVVDTAQTFYLEISVTGDCPPQTPLTATVTLTPASGVCSCGCAAAAGHAVRPAAAPPFEIEMHKPGGGAVKVTGKTTTVGVGEPVDLSLACVRGGREPTGPFSWELPAGSGYPVTLSKYEIDDDATKTSTTLVKLTKFTNATLSFYLLKPGTYTVTATASVNGTPRKATASFDVQAPQAEFTAKTCKAGLDTRWTYHLPAANAAPPRLSLGLNDGQCVTTPGMTWTAKVELKSPVLADGDLAVVQLVQGTVRHSTSKKACLDTNGKWVADGGAFYTTGTFKPKVHGNQVTGFSAGTDMIDIKAGKTAEFTSLDAPSVKLKNGGTWKEYVNFTDYLVYRPNYKATGFGHIGIWVALRHLSWTFHASASFNTKTRRWVLGKVTNPNKKQIGSIASSREPQFAAVATTTHCS
ncbi:MAG TPA: hypothetical protein VN695_13025 [Streptosporangiaceae bacterium]|nr:hypothetical protein [Streptosporangiaceae bacterium]